MAAHCYLNKNDSPEFPLSYFSVDQDLSIEVHNLHQFKVAVK